MDLITQKLSRQLSPKLLVTHSSATPTPVVLPESVFGTALRHERRRTERSGRRFVLMLVTPSVDPVKQTSAIGLEEFASALSYSSRETDLIGWHQQENAILGAIFTELGNAESGVVVDSLRQKVRSVVDKLALEKEESIRLSFHFFPPDQAPEKTLIPALHGEPYQEPQ